MDARLPAPEGRGPTKGGTIVRARSILLAAGLWALTAAATETDPVEIREWNVPWEQSRPRDPYVAGPDSVWFVGQAGHYLASINPATGEFARVDLEDGAGPHNLIVGKDGVVWYAANRKGYIGRLEPKTGAIRRIQMPDPAARDPHTLIFDESERHIWFTVQGGNFVGRLRVVDESVDLIAVPTRAARPYGIVIASDGTPWVVLFGSHKLASIDPETLELTEHALPRADTRPRRLGLTSDGSVWYVDYHKGYLGVFDPSRETVREWRTPGGEGSRPYGLAVDSADRIWFVETGASPNRFVGFDSKSERFVSETNVPSGAGSVRHMDYDESTGTIWFGTDFNTVGYAKVH